MTVPGKCLTIIIPVFNEATAIGSCLRNLQLVVSKGGIDTEILVVDDGSTDDTARLAEEAQGNIRLLRHGMNRGYGAALKTGLKHATYDLICIMDGDNTYPPEAVPSLFGQMDHADMVVAWRDKPNIPWQRKPAKWFLGKLAEYLSGSRIPDLNSGLRIFRKTDAVRFMHLFPDGFSFTTTITLAMLTHGYNVHYFPVTYHARDGVSKIRPLRDMFSFFILIIRTSVYFNPLKVFVPVGLLFIMIALALYGWSILDKSGVPVTAIILLTITALQTFTIGILADLIDRQTRI